MRNTMKWRALVAPLAVAVLMLSSCAKETAPESASPTAGQQPDVSKLFEGKTIRFIVSHSAGGGADLTGRSFADSLGDLLPGKPRVTVTNESGLGGINSAYDAPADDLVVGVTSLGANLFQPLLDPENTYDPTKVQIIGAVTPEPRGALVAGDFAAAYPKLTDATGKTEAPIRFAAVVGSPVDVISEALIAPWVCQQLRLPCDMIPVADDSSSDTELMLQRGEVNSNFTSIGAISRSHNETLANHTGYVAFTYEDDDSKITFPPGMAVPPRLVDILPKDSMSEWKTIQPLVTGGGLGKTFWMGPSAPAEVVDAMRKAWADFTGNEQLYAPFEEIQTGGAVDNGISFTVEPLSGVDAQKLYDESTKTFMENRETYNKLQTALYDKYWAS